MESVDKGPRETGKVHPASSRCPVLSLTLPKPSCASAAKFCEGCPCLPPSKSVLFSRLEWVPVACNQTIPKTLGLALARNSTSSPVLTS